MIKQASDYLQNERSIPLHLSLAHTFGVPSAIILQQIRFWMASYSATESTMPENKRMHYHEDRWWVYNTYEQWQSDNFGFWSRRTIQRHIINLEDQGVLISGEFNKSDGDRTKWYTIDFDVMDKLVAKKMGELTPSRQSGTMPHRVKVARPSRQSGTLYNIDTEITTEITKSIADKPQAVKNEKSKPRDLLFDVLATVVFDAAPGTDAVKMVAGRVGKLKRWCTGGDLEIGTGKDKFTLPGCNLDVTPDHIRRWARAYHKQFDGATLPRNPDKFAEHFYTWLQKDVERFSEAPSQALTDQQIAELRQLQFSPLPTPRG